MKLAGFGVHLFTGLGSVCALMALLALMAGEPTVVFWWLGLAFVIDGVDGPIARAVKVKEHLPRFSGETIDLVIDYLTYVFIPALLLLHAGRLPQGIALGLTVLMLLSSLFHFADTKSKAGDLAFVGFPAIWNVVAFYVFALDLGPWSAAALVVACAGATFVPMHWVHPVRVRPLRAVTLGATLVWAMAAVATLSQGFPAHWLLQVVLVGVAIYGLGITYWLTRRGTGEA